MKQLTEHVWIFPPDKDPNRVKPSVGVITTPTQTILIDAGNSPSHAREIHAALQQMNMPPVSHIIYTHHHWDHIFGAKVFNVPVIAHLVCDFRTRKYAEHPWGVAHVARVIEDIPELRIGFSEIQRLMADEWDTWNIILPSIIIRPKKDRIQFDGITLEIEHIGGKHSDDSTLITVIEDGVMFLGDCFYPPPAFLRQPDDALDSVPDYAMLTSLLNRNHTWYVDGHSGAFKHSFWQTLIGMNKQ